jgi:hypothetical protein
MINRTYRILLAGVLGAGAGAAFLAAEATARQGRDSVQAAIGSQLDAVTRHGRGNGDSGGGSGSSTSGSGSSGSGSGRSGERAGYDREGSGSGSSGSGGENGGSGSSDVASTSRASGPRDELDRF